MHRNQYNPIHDHNIYSLFYFFYQDLLFAFPEYIIRS